MSTKVTAAEVIRTIDWLARNRKTGLDFDHAEYLDDGVVLEGRKGNVSVSVTIVIEDIDCDLLDDWGDES